MQQYIVELSKYLIVILTAFFTLDSLLVFRFKKESHKKGCYIRQGIYLFLIQFLAFYTMGIKSGNADYFFLYGFVQVFLFAVMILTGLIWEKCNRLLLNNMCMFLGTGLIILARLSTARAIRQLAIAAASYVIALFVPWIFKKARKYMEKGMWVYAVLGAGALLLVLVLGNLTKGSKITFSIGDITFQPSEFVKILFVLFLAAALWESTSLKRLALTSAVAAVHVVILVLSRDLGSALIFFIAFVFVVFMATDNYWYLLLGLGALAVSSVVAYFLFSHVQVRVLAWLEPFSYIDNQGYQITQSLFAIGTGGWFGMGLLGGTPGDIPHVDTDFIFSAICEEMGVITGICILLICVSCFLMMLQMGMQYKDKFCRLLSLGLGLIYIFQVFLTVGGGIKFIPLTGVTLPFISYGGSSVFATMLLFFLAQALYMRQVSIKKPLPKVAGKGGQLRVREENGQKSETKTEETQ